MARFERVSGTAEDGVWQATLSVPQGAAAGSWDYTGSVQDAINYLGFGSAAWQNQSLPASAPGALTVTDAGASAPPQIASLGYSPSSVDVGSGSASVTFTAHFDEGSPITGAYVSLVNSAASQQVNGQFERVGTAEDGVWLSDAFGAPGRSGGKLGLHGQRPGCDQLSGLRQRGVAEPVPSRVRSGRPHRHRRAAASADHEPV